MSSSSSQSGSHSSSIDYYSLSETELTLGLPGTKTAGTKRGFFDAVDLHLATSTTTSTSQNSGSNLVPSTPKGSVVGWPPVRANRKNVMKSCKYVKVAVDGAPYLRKVDLEIYDSYEHLLKALENMFGCLTIHNCHHLMNEKKFMDPGNVIEYIPTYEDKDGDWMLVGDVPWKMFVESCKRIRLMISSEDIHLAPMRITSKCRGSSEKNNECVLSC